MESSAALGSQIETQRVVAIQANVPMSGLTESKWDEYRRHHIRLAENALSSNAENPQSAVRNPQSTTVIFPESPMNFMYETDPETREFIDGFARKNNVSVLFNSAEPNHADGKYFNSAVMVGPQGGEVAQYDKIYLLPFGEAVPFPLEGLLPGFVGNFSYGREYDLLPIGDAKAGVMICFESHFGSLSREYVRHGADAIIEMTNDGYLGPTPVLRQHLANAVFRAVETNRPVLRVTNVGITAYIIERGEVLDPAQPYTEDTRVWSVARSDGSKTFYVRYGDWFAWLCTLVTIGLFGQAIRGRKPIAEN
jgi:apolipoprotein N-acyltransferase